MSTKDLSGIGIVKKNETTKYVVKQIITLGGIRIRLLIRKAG